MKKYTNEDYRCPVCSQAPSDYEIIHDSMIDGNLQLQFECFNCRSTWDLIYNAFAVVNLEERHEEAE